MFNKLFATVLWVFALSLAGGAVFAATDFEIQDAITKHISIRHPTEDSEWWRRLGPGVPKVIIQMYETSTSAYTQLRLVQGLAWFKDDPEADSFLKDQSASSPEPIVRDAAIRSLGLSQGEKEVDFIAKYLKSEREQGRFVAAETLKMIGGENADRVLKNYEATEKTPWIVAKLHGQTLRPTAKLTPVASNEEGLAREAYGVWAGLWILPKRSGPGMSYADAELRLGEEAARGLTIELSVKRGARGEAKRFTATKLDAQRTKLRISVPIALLSVTGDEAWIGSAKDLVLEGEWVKTPKGVKVFEFRAPEVGGILSLKKSE